MTHPALHLYGCAANALFPFFRGRLRRGHETGFEERCGRYAPEKRERLAEGKTLWLHAVSVGEVQAAAPIAAAARADGWDGNLLVSTVTETGARNAEERIGERMTAHVYAPWDVPRIVARACDALSPALYVTVETEVWPNLLRELRRRGVPRFLANARISDRTFARAARFGPLLRAAYDLFDLILARGEEDARRLAAFGIPQSKIRVTGDTKIDAILAQKETARQARDALRKRLALPPGRVVLVAGSTHPGEDEVVLDAFCRFQARCPERASLLLVPRHPKRAPGLLACAGVHGRAALLSTLPSGEACAPDIVVVDEIGVLFALYGLASAAFVGGSLVPKGGQNILEPAVWNVPIQHGSHMDDFAEPTAAFDALGFARPVRGAEELAAAWERAAERGEGVAGGAEAYFLERAGAGARNWRIIADSLASAGICGIF